LEFYFYLINRLVLLKSLVIEVYPETNNLLNADDWLLLENLLLFLEPYRQLTDILSIDNLPISCIIPYIETLKKTILSINLNLPQNYNDLTLQIVKENIINYLNSYCTKYYENNIIKLAMMIDPKFKLVLSKNKTDDYNLIKENLKNLKKRIRITTY